ncbi:SDR family NAD(P)-dependent oxidoreductase [Streptomyces vinaceus]|uniref:SDR family NAD(P)-dependent oxidoreductase n=1 Tax=Streptomyces vinaceus TaxID=1960 RepID=UPI0035DF7017
MSTHGRLASTVVLVTGCNSAVGAATTKALVKEGAAVALVARRADEGHFVASEIAAAGGRTLLIDCDVFDREQAEQAVRRAVGEFGRLDTLVNHVGHALHEAFASTSADDWDRVVADDLRGWLHLSRAALPHLLTAAVSGPRYAADVINVHRAAYETAVPGGGAVALTRLGVVTFTKVLRQELKGSRVRVSAVHPGSRETEPPAEIAAEIVSAVTRDGIDVTTDADEHTIRPVKKER